jgi:hypothetical protein
MPAEKLPVGFTRRDSGSLHVQIRMKGHEPVVKNFPLLSRDPDAKRRQLADAKSWAEEARRKMMAGSTRFQQGSRKVDFNRRAARV